MVTNVKPLHAFINEKELEKSMCNAFDQEVEESASGRKAIDSAGIKVLGLKWDVKTVYFVFGFSAIIEKCDSSSLTKRNTLSVASTIFDPLGLISPISVQF